jgi:hypothetical protein
MSPDGVSAFSLDNLACSSTRSSPSHSCPTTVTGYEPSLGPASCSFSSSVEQVYCEHLDRHVATKSRGTWWRLDTFAMKFAVPFLLALCITVVDAQFTLLDIIRQTNDLSRLYTIINESASLTSLYTSANEFTLFAPSNLALGIYLNSTTGRPNQEKDLEAAIDYALAHGVFPSVEATTIEATTTREYITSFLTNIRYTNVTGGQRMIMRKTNTGNVQIESGNKTISFVRTAVRNPYPLPSPLPITKLTRPRIYLSVVAWSTLSIPCSVSLEILLRKEWSRDLTTSFKCSP